MGKEKETASTSRRHLRTICFITFRGPRTHVVSVVRLCHCQTVRMNDSFKGSVFFFNHSRDIFRSSQIKSSVDEFAIVHFWQRLGLCTHFKFQGVKNNRNHSHSLDLRIHRLQIFISNLDEVWKNQYSGIDSRIRQTSPEMSTSHRSPSSDGKSLQND